MDRVPERAGPAPARLRQPRRARPRALRARSRGRRAPASRWSPAAIPASSPWRRPCSRRVESGDPAWRSLDIRVEPGITAMLAAAARVGAPLGGDFCAMSLSDNLKPWEVVEARLRAALARRFRGRALQPDLVGPALAARRGVRDRRRDARPRHAGHLRARRRAAGRARSRILPLAEARGIHGRHVDHRDDRRERRRG